MCPFKFLKLPSGVSSGSVLVFDVPSKGSNITLSEVLEEHKEAITDIASECSGSLVLTYSNFHISVVFVFSNIGQMLFIVCFCFFFSWFKLLVAQVFYY